MRLAARLITTTLLLVAIAPAHALAWANGAYRDGLRGQGYGTHDWILDRAIKLAGAQGSWVSRSNALGATDDPDYGRSPAGYHVYRKSGGERGAAHAVSTAYSKAIAAYQAGDRVAASRYLGQLSHYYTDATQPFHTVHASSRVGSLHWSYEQRVNDHQHKSGNVSSWITRRPAAPVRDIRKRTVSAAAYARARHPALASALRSSNSVTTGTTGRITREVMSRAANDLADIIRTIPTGKGKAPAPATTTMRFPHIQPAQRTTTGAYIRCLDASGRPMEAVAVYFVWPTPSGTMRVRRYTEADGRAHYYGPVGSLPVYRRATVKLEVLGKERASAWFMPTRPLVDGPRGWAVTCQRPGRFPTARSRLSPLHVTSPASRRATCALRSSGPSAVACASSSRIRTPRVWLAARPTSGPLLSGYAPTCAAKPRRPATPGPTYLRLSPRPKSPGRHCRSDTRSPRKTKTYWRRSSA